MVTSRHEATHRILQDRPELLKSIFRIFDLPELGDPVIETLSPDTTEIRPLERRVDSVLRITPESRDAFLLAIESQGREAPAKERSWAYYQCYLQEKYACPVLLLVLCQQHTTAKWAAGPFDFECHDWKGMTLRPLVLGPGDLPVITKTEDAEADLALAAFSAVTHGQTRHFKAILEALAPAVGRSAPAILDYFGEFIEIGLADSPAALELWRDLMHTGSFFPGRGTLVERNFNAGKALGEATGRAAGEAAMVIRLLESRGITLSAGDAARVRECTDLDTLGRWFDRALHADSALDVFAEDAEQAPSDRG
jgi:hypothetical protein